MTETCYCNWDSLFFETCWCFLLFGCWLFGNVLASSLRHLQSATSFIPASCSEPVKLHAESVRNILRFQHPKMASQFLSKNGREDSVNFGLFRVVFECCVSMFEAFWVFLRFKKITQNFAFPQGHLHPFPTHPQMVYESMNQIWIRIIEFS